MLHATADTGFLIALERNKLEALRLVGLAKARQQRLTVPTAVVAEWWRGAARQREILSSFVVEPMSERLAKTAGEALAAVRAATVIDAIVMASAASRGDIVYTSDPGDLARLHGHFRGVKGVHPV